MRNIIFLALLTALATVVGCQDKAPAPAGETMKSMDTESKKESMPAEETMTTMDTQTETMEKEKDKKGMQQSPETMEAAATAEAPANGEGAGAAQ